MDLIQQGTIATKPAARPHFARTAVLTAITVAVVAAVIFAASLTLGRPGASAAADVRLSGDNSQEYVEALRGTAFQRAVTFDASYDQVEAQRGAALLPAVTTDHSYDQVELLRMSH
jgi:hypothetical protein